MLAASHPARRWLFPTAVASLAALSAFVLPWAHPPTHPAYSQSYVVGFNNKLAIALLGLLSLAVLAISLRRRGPVSPTAAPSKKLGIFHLLILGGAALLWLGTISWMLNTAGLRSIENSYFLPQMEKVFYHHRILYSQVEFPYGPLLFYPTLVLAHFFKATPDALSWAYVLTLLLQHLLGLGMLFAIVNRLPLTRFIRIATFYTLGSYIFNPWLGLNYTLFRFLVCFFCLIFLARIVRPSLASAWTFLAAILILYTSSEMGVAFVAGVLAYSTARARAKGAYLTAASALAACLLYFVTIPPDLLRTLSHFSSGFHNTPLLPTPDILIALTAAVWLAPRAVAGALKSPAPSAPMLAGFYVSSLTLIPSMLGAADPMHVLSNSLGLLLLAAVFVSSTPPLQRAWAVATAVTYLLFFFQCTLGVRYPLAAALKCDDPNHSLASVAARISPSLNRKFMKVEGEPCRTPLPASSWSSLTQGKPFMIPFSYDPSLLGRAVRSAQYKPSYFYAQIPMWSSAAQQIQVDELRTVNWALIPTHMEANRVSPDSDILPNLSIHFPERHSIFRDELVVEEIRSHWIPVATLAPGLELYHRVK